MRIIRGRRPVTRRTFTAYVFLSPFLLLFITFVVVPTFYGLYISLFNWNPLLANNRFVGLDNYLQLFTPGTLRSGDFWQSIGAIGLFTLISVPFLLVVPFALALLHNSRSRGAGVFRSIYFAPYVLGVGVIGVLWKFLLDSHLGPINAFLNLFGIGAIPWTVDTPWVWVTLVIVSVWWVMGFNIVVLLAALKGVRRELYDAASVDGAGPWRQMLSVTLPGIRPVILFVTTVTILSAANMFGQSYLITSGGPGNQTRTAIMYISDLGLGQNQMGAASAMSYVMFAFLAIISIVNFRL